jgi:uncharacterized iron-regulated protein
MPNKRTCLVLCLCWLLAAAPTLAVDRLYDLNRGATVTLEEALPQLLSKRMVVVGEQHSEVLHHEMQRKVIAALEAAGEPVAVGLEMFRRESQADLDRWVAGELSPAEFEKAYYRNWNYPWAAYRPVFDYARENGVPLVGLNVAGNITRQVARGGFQSLSAVQRGQLPAAVTCEVDAAYMDYIRQAFGAHAHGGMDFTNFCEAQLVWDKSMALHAIAYLQGRPDARMVILTGIGHAWKPGIPAQIAAYGGLSAAVILPEVPGNIAPGRTDAAVADFIFLMP